MGGSAKRRGRGEAVTETTRYLCAAAYLDRKFTDQVINEVFEEEYRFVAPSYGVDIATVINHCLVAHHRNKVVDGILAGALALGVYFFLIGRFGLWALMFLGAWALVFADQLSRRHGILVRRLSKSAFDPDDVVSPGARATARLARLQAAQDGNVSVYSGFVPFVGSGTNIGGWSFVVDTARPASDSQPDRPPIRFTVEELHDHIVDGIIDLDLPGLTVADRLYVDGRDIRDDTRFLADPFSRPKSNVDPALVRALMRDPVGSARHYLSVRIVEWKGELIVSVFLRLFRTGKNLFVEASYFVLPSLRDQYHMVDELSQTPTPRQIVGLVRSTLGETVWLTIASPARVLHAVVSAVQGDSVARSARKAIRENPRFDYGAKTSIRESGTAMNYRHYFQKLDNEMYIKIVEREILEMMVTFLDARHVDTSEFKERRNVIYNNGVMVSAGGSVQTEAMAVGQQAKATIQKLAPKARAATKD